MTESSSQTIDLALWLWSLPTVPTSNSAILYVDECGREISAGEFVARVDQWQLTLSSTGIQNGDLVLCAAHTTMAWIEALCGLWRCGAVPIVGRPMAEGKLSTLAESIGAAATLQLTDGNPDIRYIRDGQISPLDRDRRLKFGQLTSGSTGKPKVVGHYESGLRAFAETIPALYGATPNSRILTAADLSFGYGFGNSVLIPLLTGTTAVLWNRPTATDELISALVAHKIDIAALSPRIWAAIARRSRNTAASHDLAGLSTAVSAGEPLPDNLRQELEARIGGQVIDGYGATEVLHIVATRCSTDAGFTALPTTTLATATDPGGSDRPLLTIEGPMASSRYLVAPESDHARLQQNTFISGDAVQPSGRGFAILGRADDLLNRGGILFSPVEVENAAREVLSTETVVAEITLDGVSAPRLVMGVADNDANEPVTNLSKATRSALSTALDSHLVPDTCVSVPRIPLTSTGKIDRGACHRLLARRVGSRLRWRDLSSRFDSTLVVLPCAGTSAEPYVGLADHLDMRVAVIEYDLQQLSDLDRVARTITEYVLSETQAGDILLGHSLGVALLGLAQDKYPDHFGDRIVIACAPPPVTLTAVHQEQLIQHTEHMLMSRLIASPAALNRARRRIANDLTLASSLMTELRKPLTNMQTHLEITMEDDPISTVAPVTMCHRHQIVSRGGHYLPITDPAKAAALIAHAPTPAMKENAS